MEKGVRQKAYLASHVLRTISAQSPITYHQSPKIMFTIDIQQRQYKTYILSDKTAGTQIEVVPERGGIITSWLVQGQEIFYMDAERFTHADLSVR
ncbi:MAG: hypothetical protein AN487_19915, partial [Anabaena sp. CRKS33]